MMTQNRFDYEAPRTLAQVAELVRTREDATLLAGGTDFMPLWKKDLKQPQTLIGLSRVAELQRIELRDGGLFIGSMNRLADLAVHREVCNHYPVLADAARMVASPQIRNVATIGGNICQDRRCIYFNQSRFWRQGLAPCFKTGGTLCHQQPRSRSCRAIYYADLAPVLIALQARVVRYEHEGYVEQPVMEFIKKHVQRNGNSLAQAPPDLVSGFILPTAVKSSQKSCWAAFMKHSVRSAIDFALINAAIACRISDAGGKTPSISIVTGAVAPEPIALSEAVRVIKKQIVDGVGSKETWSRAAVSEIEQKSALIRDAGLSLKARKAAFGVVGALTDQLYDYLQTQPHNH